MAKKNDDDLRIEVRGRDKSSTTLLCQITEDALISAGVGKVDVINQHGDHLRHKPNSSLLDIIERYDPNFFASHIRIFIGQPEEVPIKIMESSDVLEDGE